ncbi:cytochrome P450 [Dothidotthia symphoricarpi CBS 119687]|uniref:Cytochrome P450 n=1 Tax=Dothidotthia symphoricarpi CBS 119687 TaxID=1392245 RepID=A0A6A5ZXG9_9PLEO|nr:cytochrome P450 [Dothidotthia symphoricarpi CBS 119687]KAF2124280.1 cytochrome P450 [Dothidotthia symphoricarpi CBS 119687]
MRIHSRSSPPSAHSCAVLPSNRDLTRVCGGTMESGSTTRKGAPVVLLAAAFVAYLFALAVYRLYLHPLRKFPGPRIAAVSTLYEAYFEIWLNGQYSREIARLHDLYGPIIRVTPNELHIRDSRFFDEFYGKNLHLDKEGWDVKFGSEGGVLTTVNAAVHKRRRAALSPMFSRRSILDLIHIIHRHIDTLSARLREAEARKEPINLTLAFPALTGDIIMDYFFGFNYAQLKHPEFESFHEAFVKIGGTGHVATQIPWIYPIMNSIPDSITTWLQPAAKPILDFRRDQRTLISRTLNGETLKTNDAKRTVFQALLSSSLPAEDKTPPRLAQEAQIIIGAGVETTAFTLTIAAYHIIHTPHIYARLHADLVAAFPDATAPMDLHTLEQIPYLRACITEALRLSYGLSARNPRTRRTQMVYGDWIVPAGTCVSMTIPTVSHDETLFRDSHTYSPERWLDAPHTADGVPLERFMVCFGRGTRACLGVNLAWTELYLALGALFRRFKFVLYEPDVRDVRVGHDFFIPVAWVGGKGVRAWVESVG